MGERRMVRVSSVHPCGSRKVHLPHEVLWVDRATGHQISRWCAGFGKRNTVVERVPGRWVFWRITWIEPQPKGLNVPKRKGLKRKDK